MFLSFAFNAAFSFLLFLCPVNVSGPCEGPVPELNQKVVAFAKSRLNKKVGRGECWDLAAEALNSAGANWDKKFRFGREIDPMKDCVWPGDVIQFEGVRINYKKGNTTWYEELDHHTAIVYEVRSRGNYVLADQNTSTHGKKVGLNDLELQNVKKGKYKFFRPVK